MLSILILTCNPSTMGPSSNRGSGISIPTSSSWGMKAIKNFLVVVVVGVVVVVVVVSKLINIHYLKTIDVIIDLNMLLF